MIGSPAEWLEYFKDLVSHELTGPSLLGDFKYIIFDEIEGHVETEMEGEETFRELARIKKSIDKSGFCKVFNSERNYKTFLQKQDKLRE